MEAASQGKQHRVFTIHNSSQKLALIILELSVHTVIQLLTSKASHSMHHTNALSLVPRFPRSTMGNNRLTFFKLVQALLQNKEQLSQLNISHCYILSSEIK